MKKSKASSKKSVVTQSPKPASVSVAALSLCLLLGLAALASVTTNLDKSPLYHSLSELQKHPDKSASHANLARLYIFTNHQASAATELQLASISRNNNQTQVLGESSDIVQLRSLLMERPQRQQITKTYWESVVAEHPLYRDAWVQLLYVAQNNQDELAITKYKEKIIQLDPNYNFEKSLNLK